MTVQIKNILIWQKSGVLRNLELKRNAVNVITGGSGKGKSSILHIIDYSGPHCQDQKMKNIRRNI